MHKVKPIPAIQALTPEQRTQLDTWLDNNGYLKTIDLAKAEWGIDLKYNQVQRHFKRLQLANQIAVQVEELCDILNGRSLPIHRATEHVIQKNTLAAALRDDNTPAQLWTLQRIATNPDRLEITRSRVALDHRRESTRQTALQHKIHIDIQKLALASRGAHASPVPDEASPLADCPSPIAHSESGPHHTPPSHPLQSAPICEICGTSPTARPPLADCPSPIAHPQNGPCAEHPSTSHPPQSEAFVARAASTAAWDQQIFHIWGLTEDEQQKRALYNSMLDLGLPDDLAKLYRDEILWQAGRPSQSTHYIPVTHIRPTPASLHLPHYGATAQQIKDLIWPLKNNPHRYNQPRCAEASAKPSPIQNSPLCQSADHPIPDPQFQIQDLNPEAASRLHRLRQSILALGLTPNLTDAYLREILQLTHPDFIPAVTAYPQATNFSGAPAPPHHQKITGCLYPTPADIYLRLYKEPINPREAQDRWSLGDDKPQTQARLQSLLPRWREAPAEPSPLADCPSPIAHSQSGPGGEHPAPKSQIPNPPSVPLCASPSVPSVPPPSSGPSGEDLEEKVNAYTCARFWEARRGRNPHIVGKNAAWNFKSKLQHCPCGHQNLPCPDHGTFHPDFFTCSSADTYYMEVLRHKNLPYNSPYQLLKDELRQLREHEQQNQQP